ADQRQRRLQQREEEREDERVVADLCNHCVAPVVAACALAGRSAPSCQCPDRFSASATSGGMYFSSCLARTLDALKLPSAPILPSATTPWPSRKRSGSVPV